MEDKIMNTIEEAMENNEAMTEVCKTGMNGKLIAIIGTVALAAVSGAVVLGRKIWRKRKAGTNLVTVEVNAAETVADEKTEG